MRYLWACLFLVCLTAPAFATDVDVLKSRAEQGDVKAQLGLSSIYLAGVETAKDPAAADYWAMVAQDHTQDPDMIRAAIGLQTKAGMQLSHAQIIEARNRANQWKPAAAGSPAAGAAH